MIFLKIDSNPIEDLTPLKTLQNTTIEIEFSHDKYTEISFEHWRMSIFDYELDKNFGKNIHKRWYCKYRSIS